MTKENQLKGRILLCVHYDSALTCDLDHIVHILENSFLYAVSFGRLTRTLLHTVGPHYLKGVHSWTAPHGYQNPQKREYGLGPPENLWMWPEEPFCSVRSCSEDCRGHTWPPLASDSLLDKTRRHFQSHPRGGRVWVKHMYHVKSAGIKSTDKDNPTVFQCFIFITGITKIPVNYNPVQILTPSSLYCKI